MLGAITMLKQYVRAVVWTAVFGLGACTSDGTVGATADPLSGDVVLVEGSSLGVSAPVHILAARIMGDMLILRAEYSGGCAEHRFQLEAADAFMESYPVQLAIRLIHDDGNDPCDAVLSSEIGFGLRPLAKAYEGAYNTSSGTILLHLEGWAGTLRYDF